MASLRDAGVPLDLARGAALRVASPDGGVPMFGGCEAEGYFTSACADGARPGQSVPAATMFGNSYLQVVTFDANGPQASTLQASSQSDDPASPHHLDGTRRYARQQWTTWRADDAGDAPVTVLDSRAGTH